MHSHLLDHHSGSDTPAHRLPGAMKLTIAVATIAMRVTMPASPLVFSAVGAVLVLIIIVSCVPIRFLAMPMLWISPATIIAHLFVRCGGRADRIDAAICSRGLQ